MRVLLVEDETMNAELFVDALEPDRHEVVVERDGVAGLARARSERFDLIVLDIDLPRMSGTEICRSLRANSPVKRGCGRAMAKACATLSRRSPAAHSA